MGWRAYLWLGVVSAPACTPVDRPAGPAAAPSVVTPTEDDPSDATPDPDARPAHLVRAAEAMSALERGDVDDACALLTASLALQTEANPAAILLAKATLACDSAQRATDVALGTRALAPESAYPHRALALAARACGDSASEYEALHTLSTMSDFSDDDRTRLADLHAVLASPPDPQSRTALTLHPGTQLTFPFAADLP